MLASTRSHGGRPMVPLLLSAGLWGCSEPPVFNTITDITIKVQTPKGVDNDVYEGEKLERAKRCLYTTDEIESNQRKQEPIQEVLLLQVKDRNGDRMFELVTDENFSGGKGKYYYN